VALKQANTAEFKQYQQQVVANCQALSNRMQKLGYTIVSGAAAAVASKQQQQQWLC
jgi:glycine hydroxymethyltransferase